MLFALLGMEVILVIWMRKTYSWDLEWILLIVSVFDLALAGLSFRIGGHLAKGPYLPETLEGLSRTTKAVLGKS